MKMKRSYCNPLDLGYRYQHMMENGKRITYREAADPTLIYFKGVYYLFASMSGGFWHSSDLTDWKYHTNRDLLIYDYAPDVRQVGEYLYFCASRRGENCPILRTKDPLSDTFEQVSAPFDFWDPDLFCDDDGRVYLYWGCGNTDPIYGIEMDPDTMLPIGERRELIFEQADTLGYERCGENGNVPPKETSPVYQALKPFVNPATGELQLPQALPAGGGFNREKLVKMFRSIGKPYIEGAFMTKHNGKYYLQYASPATQFNTYCDGVYVADAPLGPFTLQQSNPFSSKPGGFMQGAGHGSTIQDADGNFWHASTMRVSVNHDMERRVGLFPAGVDADGVLFCNQNFADYPLCIPDGKFDPWSVRPACMLLSYQKPTAASSTAEGSAPALAVDENCRTWWSAADARPGQWLSVDLEKVCDIHAIQVNFADEALSVDYPESLYCHQSGGARYIEKEPQISCYTLEASTDGTTWQLLQEVSREGSNAYFPLPEHVRARYIRLTGGALPYGQTLRISGLRIFGFGGGAAPAQAQATVHRTGPMNALVQWQPLSEMSAQGCNIRYGIAPDKLYQSWLVYGVQELDLSTLMAGQDYYLRVDSFNENGITEGSRLYCPAENHK